MNINSYILKLSGKAELPKDIETGHNYHISLEGSVPKVELHDNEDGTWNKVYTFRPIKIELLDQKGEAIKLKDSRSRSQLLRGSIWRIWNRDKSELSEDDFYERLMGKIISNIDEIANRYKDN